MFLDLIGCEVPLSIISAVGEGRELGLCLPVQAYHCLELSGCLLDQLLGEHLEGGDVESLPR